jgi:DNA-binding transcriptional ArsR family regulator
MSKPPSANHQVLSAAQLRVLASPVRIEIVGVFQAHGALAIRELAEKLARPADGLYHHVRRLQKAGILHVVQRVRVGRRDEAVFALTAERFGHAAQPQTNATKEAVIQAADAALRLAGREFRRAVLLREPRQKDAPADQAKRTRAKLSRQRSWLTDDDLETLHALLEKVEAFLQERMHHQQGQPFAVTTAFVPLLKRKRL